MLSDPANNISVGDYTYGRPEVKCFLSGGKLTIGKFCSIADEVLIILGGEHRAERFTTYPMNLLFDDIDLPWHERTKGNVVIGNDVWIGTRATILSGVTIGDGAIIGAGSLVAKDVAPYEIVGGNPAVKISDRFGRETVERLVKLQWWNLGLSEIKDLAKGGSLCLGDL